MKLSYLVYPALSLYLAVGLPFGWSWQSVLSDSALLSSKPCLIKLGPLEFRIVEESDKLRLKRDKINFIDVTGHILLDEAIEQGLAVATDQRGLFMQLLGAKQVHRIARPNAIYTYPTAAKHTRQLVPIFKDISPETMRANLGNFTSFYTRYYKSKYGYELALWLQEQINKIISPAAKLGVTLTPIHHESWDQFSIVVLIPGLRATPSSKGKVVVVGSHQDSTNLLLPNLMRAPGADDDGSGTVTCLEALRLLILQYCAGEFVPENTLEFHFYSAEEGGLLGSIDVFTRYKMANETVVGMLQQDMTGYSTKAADAGVEPHMGIIIDYTTPSLNNFVKLMVDTYCDIPYHETKCGYACSDHSSAFENGYPASFVIESEFSLSNGYIHSVADTIDKIDWNHVVEHVKLTLGFAYELSMADV